MYGHHGRACIGSHVAAAEDLVDGVAAARLWVGAVDVDGDLTADGAALVAAAIDAAVHRATGHHDSHILTTGSLVGTAEDVASHMTAGHIDLDVLFCVAVVATAVDAAGCGGLVGKQQGETVQVQAPRGMITYEILEVKY